MITRKILLASSDKDLINIVKISALTLTKLNSQISIEDINDFNNAIEKSKSADLDLIIIDNDNEIFDPVKLISAIRNNNISKNKKIITVYSNSINRNKVFKAGCDSIMNKEEFKRIVNNVLVF